MTTNELLDVAMQAMPISVLAEVDQGQVYGVLLMALMLQEEAHNEQLRRADEELQDARRRWDAKAQQLHKERDMALAYRDEAVAMLKDARLDAELMRRDRDKTHNVLSQTVQDVTMQLDELRKERDAALAEIAALKAQRSLDIQQRIWRENVNSIDASMRAMAKP